MMTRHSLSLIVALHFLHNVYMFHFHLEAIENIPHPHSKDKTQILQLYMNTSPHTPLFFLYKKYIIRIFYLLKPSQPSSRLI